ncbi:MFS general substrate transporter [Tilletiaria anomala UBC 951]|uniref:MFS general substrate transporter n=1 Tax=Tilletiaria anomala (strain ATCC 24038 / CBS 436.72 / UBC 951) TaxID=1037660 RepID=A0A066WF13_TILAU|nr:MFS general substrate transporter [Tilletiaria anomala UBC 951]KDN52557.1 MFS general substrate transporter [Tilletiaria anomala UBC 951]
MDTKELEHTKAAEAASSQDSIPVIESTESDAPPPPPVALTEGAIATTDAYRSEKERQVVSGEYRHPFRWSPLWELEVINPLNQKSFTLPPLRVTSSYFIAFWMSTLGFFVAFLSWFAFSPLMPETVKSDLKLTSAQVANSNIAALSATLLVRFVAGPLVDRFGPLRTASDRFGPRKVMVALLLLGAIPSGLAGTAHNADSLYAVRVFISILGGTFAPCQAWTTAWFDKAVVGSANALAGGWGNMGGGVTFATQTGLFERLLHDGLSQHVGWRICFVIVPVPILLFTAGLMLLIARGHPMGRWANRHETPATAGAVLMGEDINIDADERRATEKRGPAKSHSEKAVRAMIEPNNPSSLKPNDVAVNEPLTKSILISVVTDPRTWMLSLSYASTFGFELALDASLANSFKTFQQLDARYLASIYGLLNICMRFLGGLGANILYARFGITAKNLGVLIDYGSITVGKFMGFVFMLSFSGFSANGAKYALVPHISSRSNGLMAGIVGGMGNLGGILYSLIFRFQPAPYGKPYWISGIFCTGLNLFLLTIPLGDAA